MQSFKQKIHRFGILVSKLAEILRDLTKRGDIDDASLLAGAQTTSNGEYVSVKQFGAIGDGSTDDTSAIQRAINNVAGLDVIYFPKGVYKISKSSGQHGLSLVNNTYLQLHPKAKMQFATASADYDRLLEVPSNSVNITIDGGEFDGRRTLQTHETPFMYINDNVNGVIVKNTYIHDFNGEGIWVKGDTGPVSKRINIHHNKFENIKAHNVLFNWEVINSQIKDNEFYNSDVDGNAIWVGNNSENLEICKNYIENCGDIGIEIWVGSNHCTCIGNIINGATTMGISFGGGDFLTCIGNIIRDYGFIGIEVALSEYCTIQGNTIFNGLDAGAFGISVSNDPTKGNRIIGNTIKDGLGMGMQIIGAAHDTEIAYNLVHNMGDRGLNLVGPTPLRLKVNHNSIRDNGKSGIYMYQTDGAQLRYNDVQNNNTSITGGEADTIYQNSDTNSVFESNDGFTP